MYKVKNTVYADAGCILLYKNKYGFNFRNIDVSDVSEIKINIDDIYIKDKWIIYSNNFFRERNINADYGDWKKRFINKQFSIDDQIAIILNKDDSDEDLLLYKKMQEWRDWAGLLAKRIISLK